MAGNLGTKGSVTVKNLGIYIGVFFLLIGAIIFAQSTQLDYYGKYGPGPGLLPMWMGGLTVVLSILYLRTTIKKDVIPFAEALPKGEALANVLACIGAVLLFIVIVPYVGFIAASMIMLFILFKRGYNWYWTLGLSAATTLIIYWSFGVLLQVPLPSNRLGW